MNGFIVVMVLMLVAAMSIRWKLRQKNASIFFKKVSESNTVNLRFTRKKPQWVTDKVIYLKAVNPDYVCSKIAYTFNRLYAQRGESVSKSFVYDKLKQHQYQILLLRRKIKHQRPADVPKNQKWGMDLTTVTDSTGVQNQILAIIDYGTRKCLCLETLESKHTINIIRALLKAISQFGKPKYLKTDNKAVFKSWRLNWFLWLLNIKHQYSDVASPWQNGRIERLIGTFKERIKHLMIHDAAHLSQRLPDFVTWYNAVRPHNYLDGKTPNEVWYQDRTQNQNREFCQAWEGLLTGFKPI